MPGQHSIVAWLVEFAAVLVNRYEVGHDGKTPYERLRGRSSKLLGLEFGEMVNFRRTRLSGKLAKLECLQEHRIFLGYRSTSGEVIVGTGRASSEPGPSRGNRRSTGGRRRTWTWLGACRGRHPRTKMLKRW